MENNKNTKIALSIVIMLIVILISVMATAVMYKLLMDTKNAEQESVSVNSSLNNETDDEPEYDIDGTYTLVVENGCGVSYEFSDGVVKYENVALSKEGTYEIVENKIKITYKTANLVGEGSTDDFEKEEELTIVDNNTLTSDREVDGENYSGEYIKEK